MIKSILLYLSLTFSLSSFVTTIALLTNHYFRDYVDFDSSLPGLIEFAVWGYAFLAILSLTSLLLAVHRVWETLWLRLLAYYMGPAALLVWVTSPAIFHEGKYAEDWLCTIIVAIFIAIHTAFYIRLCKKGFTAT